MQYHHRTATACTSCSFGSNYYNFTTDFAFCLEDYYSCGWGCGLDLEWGLVEMEGEGGERECSRGGAWGLAVEGGCRSG